MGERGISRLLGGGNPKGDCCKCPAVICSSSTAVPKHGRGERKVICGRGYTCGYAQTKEERKNLGIVGCVEVMDLESKLNRERGEGSKGLMQWERTEILQI